MSSNSPIIVWTWFWCTSLYKYCVKLNIFCKLWLICFYAMDWIETMSESSMTEFFSYLEFFSWQPRLPDFFEASVPDWLWKSASRGFLVPDPLKLTFIAFLLPNFFGKIKFFNFFFWKNIIFKNIFLTLFPKKILKMKSTRFS